MTHFKLLPGEEVRAPRVALVFWKGDWIRGQNLWRQWLIGHNMPRPGGKLPPAHHVACSSRQTVEMQEANEENQKMFVQRDQQEGFKINYYWMDAGWQIYKGGWWNTGTWEVEIGRFPRGLRAVSDFAHSQGVKIAVWFQTERVAPGSWLYQEHPEWLLGRDGQDKLLYLGICKPSSG